MSLANSRYTFAEILAEYYTLYRGQGASTPAFGDREFTIGIHLANNAIKKWDRADGTLWRELMNTLQAASDGTKTLSAATSYVCPTDMRKPPGFVRLTDAVGNAYFDLPVIEPQDVKRVAPTGTYAYFIGSASGGYTMFVPTLVATTYSGRSIDYVYHKKPKMMTLTPDPSALVPEASDPNFIIQWMLYRRLQQSRNPYSTEAKAEALQMLADMKLENNSGTFGNTMRLPDPTGNWGSPEEVATSDGRNLII